MVNRSKKKNHLDIFVVLPIPNFDESCCAPTSPTTEPPLLTYHSHLCLASSAVNSRPAPDSTPTADFSPPSPQIVFWKGVRSTHNVNPHYTHLSYHCMSSPCYACIFFSLFQFLSLQVKHCLIQDGTGYD